MKLNQKQRGMTAIGMAMVGVLVAIIAFSAFKLYPSYYDDFAVSTALENIEADGSKFAKMSPKELRATLNKKISISGVKLAKENVDITKNGDKITIAVNYEVRTQMYGNIDAITKFSHSITISK